MSPSVSTWFEMDLAYLLGELVALEDCASDMFLRLDRLAVEGPYGASDCVRGMQGSLAEWMQLLGAAADVIERAYELENPK